MKKYSREEFIDRIAAIKEAEKIFILSGITDNISIAFELYQKVLADKVRPLQLDSSIAINGAKELKVEPIITLPIDIELEKPLCPDCQEPIEMNLRPTTNDEKNEGYNSCWTCPMCGFEGLSEKSVMRWIRELPEKGQEIVTVESGTDKKDLP